MTNTDANHPVKDMPMAYDKVKDLMDQDTYAWHHDKHYAGYVNKRNEIENGLKAVDMSKANVNYSAIRSLKLEETWNANGQILHEVYWGTMGGDGRHDERMYVVKRISEDFGSFDKFKEEFLATGKSGRGWVALVYDMFTDGKLRCVMYDFHNQGGIAGSLPILAVDLFEHAYYHKYGPDRGAYLNALMGNINWKAVEERYRKYSAYKV
ncbi:MAG: superoxide dismutase [Candidatus Marsarchaeota archaeon]|jgi:Fe-Mn family superoxide dismutase|nr:superoxide dismutase [Candidatus Marsarchaeota archaeon]